MFETVPTSLPQKTPHFSDTPIPQLAESRTTQLAIVIPTFNERENIPYLLVALNEALKGFAWEAIFVDDHSPDGTAEYLRGVSLGDGRVRVIERVGRHGLASACIEGIMSTAAPYIAVMDADLQNDESILPQMLEKLRTE